MKSTRSYSLRNEPLLIVVTMFILNYDTLCGASNEEEKTQLITARNFSCAFTGSVLVYNQFYNHGTHLKSQNEISLLKDIQRLNEVYTKLLKFYSYPEGSLIITNHYVSKIINDLSTAIMYVPDDANTMLLQNVALTMKISERKTFMLNCTLKCAATILQYIQSLYMNTKDYVWVVVSKKILYLGLDLPKNLLVVEAERVQNNSLSTNCTRYPSVSSNKTKFRIKTVYKQRWKTVAFYRYNTIHFRKNSSKFLAEFPIPESEMEHDHFVNVVTIEERPFTVILAESEDNYDRTFNKCRIGKVCWKTKTVNNLRTEVPYCCVGYCIDLLIKLEADLSFKSYVYIVEDSVYGQFRNGSWVGMVGDLVMGKANLILAPLTINLQRSKYISYSYPFMVSGLTIVTIIKKTDLPFFNIEAFLPLSLDLWIIVLLLTILVSFTLVMMEGKCEKTCTKTSYPWNESISYVAGLLFQRDLGAKNPTVASSRLCAIAIATGVMIIMSTYTAVLTANNVTYENKLPVTGFDDEKIKHPSHQFKFGTLENSAFTQMFSDSTDPAWRTMNQFMKTYNFKSSEKAFEMLKNGELDAVLNDYYISLHYMSGDPECRMQFAGDMIKEPGYGLATQKGSFIGKEISSRVQSYRESGFLQEIENKWILHSCSTNNGKDTVAEKVGVFYFGGLLTFLIGTIFLSGFIFLLELVVFSLCRKR